ncbi:metallophosphoesterase family protein [Alsobacter sp. R-9]
MLTAVFADVHSNREALTACLADARRRGAERLVFLGDLVGYGADPEWVCETVAQLVADGAVAIRGNHDAAAVTPDPGMTEAAAAAIAWTRGRLSQAQVGFLAGLPLEHADGEVLFVHANAWAPEGWGYIRSTVDAERSLRSTTHRVTLCGHTHVPALYHMAPLRPPALHQPGPGVALPLAMSRRWLAVLGAVGQPRDGSPAACYGLLSDRPSELTFVRVAYDVDAAARKILAAGLPESLASRLARGR